MKDTNCVSVRGAEGFGKGTAEGCSFRDGFLRLDPGRSEGSFTTEWVDCDGLSRLVLWWNGLTPGDSFLVPRARIRAGGRISGWMRWGEWRSRAGGKSFEEEDDLCGVDTDTLTMKEGALLTNAGHFNVEVDVAALEREAVKKEEQRHNIVGYTLKNGRTLSLLGEGRLVNLACGDGHPAEIMDMSFAVQALSAEYLVKHRDDNLPMINQVPEEIDREIALRKLTSMDVRIDQLTEAQEQYRNSFDLE